MSENYGWTIRYFPRRVRATLPAAVLRNPVRTYQSAGTLDDYIAAREETNRQATLLRREDLETRYR